MKKSFLLLIPLLILFLLYYLFFNGPQKIGLIPLDSRPCNTQYAEVLGEMGNMDIVIPSEHLDNYLKPADKESLWKWLETEGTNLDTIIINTTELFNGGLIASRDPNSYVDLETNLQRLKGFLKNNKDKNIIVITILPRLLPSQFTELWTYKDELTNYAIKVDEASLNNEKIATPQNIPPEILTKYINVYQNAEKLTKNIINLAQEGLIDYYLIGQDDAEKHGLTNKLIRNIKEDIKDNIHFLYGADELTMLTLAKLNLKNSEDTFALTYTNENLKNEIFPFEAADLETGFLNKLKYLGVGTNSSSLNQEIIYNDFNTQAKVLNDLNESSNKYLGLMDISFTNKGDIGLYQKLKDNHLLKKLDGYSGWNTASNTIGTEIAHFFLYNELENSYYTYAKESQVKALKAYVKFKYIRYAEDFIYQGIIRDKLIKTLRARGIDPYNLKYHKDEAEKILKDLYEPYRLELEKALIGKYKIGNLDFEVEEINSTIELPWERTFEAKVIVDIKLKTNRP